MFKNLFISLMILFSYSSTCFSITIEIPLSKYDAVFFDSSESNLMNETEKRELPKKNLGPFFLLNIAPEIQKMGIPWTHNEYETIHEIFHKLLTSFDCNKEIFFLKIAAEELEN